MAKKKSLVKAKKSVKAKAVRKQKFAGDKKASKSLLMRAETVFKLWAVPKLPEFIETYHLTMMTVIWSAVNVYAGFLVKTDLRWLHLVNGMIILQYITDLFDGELGRQRKTGLIKWGFYMDHFLDYVFLASMVFVGYMLSPGGLEVWYFGLLVILGSYMVNSFLNFAATNEFEIAHFGIGPTETRLVFIMINLYIIFFGTEYFHILVPAIVLICLLGLVINTIMIQSKLWRVDMQAKKKK